MDTSTRASVFAEPAPAVSDRRWDAWRRAARARLAPFGAAVLLAAIVVALAAPLLSPYDPLAQDLGNVLARPGRGRVLGVRTRDCAEAARALGASGWWIARRHVLPNAATPIVVQASLSVAFAILAEASLSFLGLGIQPPAASWGSMINAGRGYLPQAPWIVFGPGAALVVTVVGLSFVGDG